MNIAENIEEMLWKKKKSVISQFVREKRLLMLQHAKCSRMTYQTSIEGGHQAMHFHVCRIFED